MRKKRYALLLLLALFAIALLPLAACYDGVRDGDLFWGVGGRDAFFGAWHWDGNRERMELTVPDEYEGKRVTALGGYAGRGYPCPFAVVLPETFLADAVTDEPTGEAYETLVFTVHLGKNIEEVYASTFHYYDRNEGDESVTVYKVVYRFTVDEENPVFTAVDGKLYRRGDTEPLDAFFYE